MFEVKDTAVDEEAAKKYHQLLPSESIKNVSMWVGSHTCEVQMTHVLNEAGTAFESRSLIYPPSIVQVFMEQIANALDHRNEYPNDTTVFRFSFDKTTGEASVMNNGKSMPVVVVRDATKTPVWCPQLLCSGFLTSSNHNKTSGAQRITLGAHGIGLKSMTSMSMRMRVECVDLERKLYYCQDILECNTKIMPPTIVALDKKNKPPPEMKTGGTRFTYTLDYSFYKSLPQDIFTTMDLIFRARTYQVAGYSGVVTYYNEEKIPIKTAKALAEMYFPDVSYFELQHPEWNLGVGIAPVIAGKPESISIINGGFIPQGVHFKHIFDKIVDDLKPKVEKFLKDKVRWDRKLVKGNISLIIIGTLPDLQFDAQIKNKLGMKNHTEYFKLFKWPSTYADKVWNIVKIALGEKFIINSKTKGGSKGRKLENPGKYTPAGKLRTAESDLLAFEGDSARSSAITAMTENLSGFSRESKGIILLGGCPVNVRKHMTDTKIGATTYRKPDKMVLNNSVWNDFMTVMNLQYDKKYDTTESLRTLNYQHYTNITDKDMHGMGKIGAIMIGNISQFWPELLAVPGFLGYFDSILIRAYPSDPKKSAVMEFGSQEEYNSWRISTFPNGIPSAFWDVKYFKGMAGHNDEECVHMFRNYGKLRMAYTDDQKAGLLRIAGYFGKDVDLRKELLRLPVEPIPWVQNRRSIELQTYCDYYVREEQQYNIICKLNNVYDGFIFNHRKIAYGAMKYKNSSDHNNPILVFQLGGYIAKETSYHHGDASLNGSIIWMSQDFVGARNIPHLLPLSQMGSRFSSEDDVAPRYVYTQCNPIVDLIYPSGDRELYDFLIEDGKETVPKYFVPVICMPVLETNSLPGTGWRISKLARDYHDHVANIHRMLDGLLPERMRAWTPGWHGDIIEINGVEWSIGKCTYNAASNTVTITELPYQVKVDTYINGKQKSAKAAALEEDDEKKKIVCLRDRPLIKADTIVDRSSKIQISISFELMPDAMQTILRDYGNEHFDPLTEYLDLKEHFGAELNFTNADGTVVSFATYEAAMVPWFKERLQLYPKRFERRIIIINLTIKMLKNQIRYMNERSTLKISGQKKARQIEILAEAKFDVFNAARLKAPRVKNDQIESIVHGDGASYAYLLNTTDLDSSLEEIDKLSGEILTLEMERAELQSSDIVKRTWKAEIAAVTRRIDDVRINGWVPKGKYKYN
jgi:DNA topoisomerase II